MELRQKRDKFKPVSVAVCVLAHNEERFIERAIRNILNTESTDFNITVYSNGCSDRTSEIVEELGRDNARIRNVEIKTPSKVNAWNEAFNENQQEVLVFCDGDVVPEQNAVDQLLFDLVSVPERILVSTRLFPLLTDASLERRAVGFMQLPLKHEFLSGGMYAFKKAALLEKLREKNLLGIPKGITGEDYFLEHIVEGVGFYISQVKNYYEPPGFKDYIRYLARLKWQNSQLLAVIGEHPEKSLSKWGKFKRKFSGHHERTYLALSIPAVILRSMFKIIFARRINQALDQLGPVVSDGERILRVSTRANSTK